MASLHDLTRRRQMIAAVILAAENAEQIMQICSAASAGAASEALAEAFDLSEFQTQVILDMQIRRFTPEAAIVARTQLSEIDLKISKLNKE